LKILGIIPARYASSRFPGKPLADIGGKSMIQRVYEQSSKAKSLDKVIVATDDERIYNHVIKFGGKAVFTRPDHASGTDRCFEALQNEDRKFLFAINIQGDEPFVSPDQIDLVASVIDENTELATLIKQIHTEKELDDPNEAKVIINKNKEAIYFSRLPIPYYNIPNRTQKFKYYKHVGIYAYRRDILETITSLPVSDLEKSESLEQLRWIENGYKIKIAITDIESTCIDAPEDIPAALIRFSV
jgi:3-deoxy-manno-octulosonate cytidylyltransferase (CMP-KDO synthetase)